MKTNMWIFGVIFIVTIMMMPSIAGAATSVIFDGEVDLHGGTFTYTPASAGYEMAYLTDLGALQAASEKGGFNFIANDDNYANYGSFYVTSIDGVENNYGINSSWFFMINGVSANHGLGANEMSDGDTLAFYYVEYDPTTYEFDIEDALYKVEITVNDETAIFDGKVDLEDDTFDYRPAANPSASYEWDCHTDLGALQAASGKGGFDFNTADFNEQFSSFFINSINGISAADGYDWSIVINGEPADFGLGGNELSDGDTVIFYYLEWIEESPGNWMPDIENAYYMVKIKVDAETKSSSSSGSGFVAANTTTVETVAEATNTSEKADADEVNDDEVIVEDMVEDTEPGTDAEPSSESEDVESSIPGFEAVFTVPGILLSALFLVKRRM